MKHVPDAKMVDIRIVEVPHQWKGKMPVQEIGSKENHNFIYLVHQLTGTKFRVEVKPAISDPNEIARQRAEAKLAFIHELIGEPWKPE